MRPSKTCAMVANLWLFSHALSFLKVEHPAKKGFKSPTSHTQSGRFHHSATESGESFSMSFLVSHKFFNYLPIYLFISIQWVSLLIPLGVMFLAMIK